VEVSSLSSAVLVVQTRCQRQGTACFDGIRISLLCLFMEEFYHLWMHIVGFTAEEVVFLGRHFDLIPVLSLIGTAVDPRSSSPCSSTCIWFCIQWNGPPACLRPHPLFYYMVVVSLQKKWTSVRRPFLCAFNPVPVVGLVVEEVDLLGRHLDPGVQGEHLQQCPRSSLPHSCSTVAEK